MTDFYESELSFLSNLSRLIHTGTYFLRKNFPQRAWRSVLYPIRFELSGDELNLLLRALLRRNLAVQLSFCAFVGDFVGEVRYPSRKYFSAIGHTVVRSVISVREMGT